MKGGRTEKKVSTAISRNMHTRPSANEHSIADIANVMLLSQHSGKRAGRSRSSRPFFLSSVP
jgi:hypothetical protein